MSTPRLRIAILTHNALEFSSLCLNSLAAHTRVAHEISVLDNGSDDGTPDWLREQRMQNLRVMLSPLNVGVPKGRNLLLAAILPRTKTDDLIVFLDNDVEALTGWHDPFLGLFSEQAGVAIAGVTGHQIVVGQEQRELLPSPQAGPAEVDVVSGYCLWVRAGTAAALGPFDENLGLFWHEDDDYCVRAKGLGLRVCALPEAGIIHHQHKSGVLESTESEGLSLRNQRYLAQKWRSMRLVDEAGRVVCNLA